MESPGQALPVKDQEFALGRIDDGYELLLLPTQGISPFPNENAQESNGSDWRVACALRIPL